MSRYHFPAFFRRAAGLRLAAAVVCLCMGLCLSGCGSNKIASSSGKAKTYKTSTSKKSGSTGSGRKSSSSSSSGTSGSLSAISKKLGVTVTSSDNVKLYSEAAGWIGTPYKYGGTSRSGVDCSGLTYLMYKSVYGKTLSRQSAAILTNNCKQISKSSLRAGDLVFFRTDGKKSKTPNHVGIYLKANKFIHSSSSKGVVVSDLTNSYYVKNWITGGRVK